MKTLIARLIALTARLVVLALIASAAASLALAQGASTDDKWSGERTIEPVSAPGMLLEAVGSGQADGTAVSINHPSKAPNQLWEFNYKGDGFYSISPAYNANLALTAADGAKGDGVALILAADKGADYQLWNIKTDSNGAVSICPKHALAEGLDDWGGHTEPGSKVDVWSWGDDDPHLQWHIGAPKSAGSAPATDVSDKWSGQRFIASAGAPGMLLEAVGSGQTDGAIVSINKAIGSPNQIWIFTGKGDGFYAISPSYNTKLVLSADKGGTGSGTQLVLTTDKGLDWQRWSIKVDSARYVSIMAKHAPTKGIDDFMGASDPGSKQDIWDWQQGDPHLEWKIVDSKAGLPKAAPHGKMITFVYNQSKIYPGTTRSVNVYVPAQYDSGKAACVYVQQDGGGSWEPQVMDDLIASGTMPVTVGVFVPPGNLPAPNGSQRQNRNFEYDAISDDYVRFIADELLPYVVKTYNLNLSTSGNDRCIGGYSSGGIAAFNAAWNRPDAFTRVFGNSPSLVGFRGGNEYQDIVRKYEPKPIRAYLSCGAHDMVNCAGDWTEIINQFATSMAFSGYDFVFHQLEGGHCTGGGPDQFEEAMTFLWKDWPQPIKLAAGPPRYQDIFSSSAPWQVAAQGLSGAVVGASNSKGEVFFISDGGAKIQKVGLDGKISTFVSDARSLSSLSVGPNDEIFTSSPSTGKITSYDASGKASQLADGIPAQFVLARPNGGVYATVPGAGGQPSKLWLITAGSKTTVDTAGKFATGLAMTSDRWLLDMADGASKWIYSYQVNDDGTLTNRERFFRLYVPEDGDDAGAEALCYDKEGHLFAATRVGIQVFANFGPVQVIVPVPTGRVTGICIGGANQNTLYAFCGDKIFSRTIKGHALGAYTPKMNMGGSQL